MKAGRFDVAAREARHAGLYLDKFLPGETSELGQTLSDVASVNPASKVYRLAYARWKAQAEARENTVRATGTVRGRMVTGLGAASVMENGLRLHFTYGTPLIPGSTLKGILRKAMPAQHRGSRNYEWYLFGDTDHAGAAQIEDAWWIPPTGASKPPLALDVLTPHHQAYMQRQGPPTDFDEPVPVPFLSVRDKQQFFFVISAPSAPWQAYLHGLLKETLRRDGVGAKRSAGYGAMEVG